MPAIRSALALAALALAGCGSPDKPATSAGAPSPTATTARATATRTPRPRATPASYEARALAVAREYSRCARSHGRPNFPDPAVVNGGVDWPGLDKSDIDYLAKACGAIFARMPPDPRVPKPTAAQMPAIRKFARCMREHGVADWPDPNPDGSFSVSNRRLDWRDGDVPQDVTAANDACFYLEDGWRVFLR